MEDVKVREMQIFDFKKKIAEAETKLKQQQNLYEAVRSDRNLYSKNLIETQVQESLFSFGFSENYGDPFCLHLDKCKLLKAGFWILRHSLNCHLKLYVAHGTSIS